MMMELRDREPGPAQVAQQLRSWATRKYNFSNIDPAVAVNNFVAWINEVERYLRSYFVDPHLEHLHTARFWQIFQAGVAIPRLDEVIRAEADVQADRISELADELTAAHQRLVGEGGTTLAVVDTNVFLHCSPLDEIDWSFVAAPPVRVVVPLRVAEELDEKRRDRNPATVAQARKSVRWLRDRLVNNEIRVPLREGASIEAFVPIGARSYQPTADTEILDTCETLWTFTGLTVVVVTADLGMQLRGARYRADGTGFVVREVPDTYQLD
jgi:hypothetical protein